MDSRGNRIVELDRDEDRTRLFITFVDFALEEWVRRGYMDRGIESATRAVISVHNIKSGLGRRRRVGIENGSDVLDDERMPVEFDGSAEFPQRTRECTGVFGVIDFWIVGAGGWVISFEKLDDRRMLMQELVDGGQEGDNVR